MAEEKFLWAISIKGNITCGGNKDFMFINEEKDINRSSYSYFVRA